MDFYRRKLARGILVGAIAAAAMPLIKRWRGVESVYGGSDVFSLVQTVFSHVGSAQEIGRYYLAGGEGVGSDDRYRDMAALVNRLRGLKQSEMRRVFSQLSRADFAAGRVVNIDGWILSRMEVRLCAYMELNQRCSQTRLSKNSFT